MTFKKGDIRDASFIELAKTKRLEKNGQADCVICGEKFFLYSKSQKVCKKNECKRKNYIKKYSELKSVNPIMSKAITLAGNIRLGKGKRDIMFKMLIESIGKPCEYCKNIVTIENASVDHKDPRTFSKVYNKNSKKELYTKEEIKNLDRKENLHIVCRECNFLKSDMNDEQFKFFISSLKDRPDIFKKIVERLKKSTLIFKFRKK